MEADITIEPTRQRGPGKKNERDRKQLHRPEKITRANCVNPRAAVKKRGAKSQDAANDQSGIYRQLNQPPNQMQPEQDDYGTCDWSHQGFML